MNPPENDRGRDVRLLAGLCRELVRRELRVIFRDARPVLIVEPAAGPGLNITVSLSGEVFEWKHGSHDVADVTGAADEITTLALGSEGES